MKKILKIIKKLVLYMLILYSYNLIISPLGLTIPINIITLSMLLIFGFPALFSLILILVIIF